MFVGHYGVSYAVKAIENRLPLWLLFLAVQFVDILWGCFVLLGIERVRIVPGITASSPLDLYYMPYTHSLAGALAWAMLAFAFCQVVPSWRGTKRGLVLAFAVFSHWLIDLIVHRPDLAIYGNSLKVGFGLWNHRPLAFLLECGVPYCRRNLVPARHAAAFSRRHNYTDFNHRFHGARPIHQCLRGTTARVA